MSVFLEVEVSVVTVFLRRFLVVIPTLFGVILATFLIAHFIPADPLAALLGQKGMENQELVAAYRAKWGLDRSLAEQFLMYLGNLLHGDMGTSIRTQRPVVQDLGEFLPATFELAFCSLVVAVFGGVVLGVLAAVRCNSWFDQAVRVVALIGASMPVFWMALIFLQIFYAGLSWVPAPGRLDSSLHPPPTVTGMFVLDGALAGQWQVVSNAVYHLILPAIVLGWYELGLIARVTRASMLEVMSADYIRTARAKGLGERFVISRHALRNALLPTVTVIGLSVAGLMAGAVQTETIFSWPGVGRYAVDSSQALDFPAIMGVTILIACLYIGANLIVDVLYGVLDPRIRE